MTHLIFFRGIYANALDTGVSFEVSTCKFFESPTSNFIVYKATIGEGDVKQYVLGLLYSKKRYEFIDVSILSFKEWNTRDIIYFTEIINSIKQSGIQIIPTYNSITKEEQLQFEE